MLSKLTSGRRFSIMFYCAPIMALPDHLLHLVFLNENTTASHAASLFLMRAPWVSCMVGCEIAGSHNTLVVSVCYGFDSRSAYRLHVIYFSSKWWTSHGEKWQFNMFSGVIGIVRNAFFSGSSWTNYPWPNHECYWRAHRSMRRTG